MNQRRNLVDNQHELSVRKQCDLLSVHKSSLYYAPKGRKPGKPGDYADHG